MNRKRSSFVMPTVGGSSLLVIFAVLCLLTFALLTLSTTLANERLSEASLTAVSTYYEADAAAEEIFARLRMGEMPEGVKQHGDIYTYTCAMSNTQSLLVELSQRDGTWRVERWQAVSTTSTDIDTSIDVWDGQVPEE